MVPPQSLLAEKTSAAEKRFRRAAKSGTGDSAWWAKHFVYCNPYMLPSKWAVFKTAVLYGVLLSNILRIITIHFGKSYSPGQRGLDTAQADTWVSLHKLETVGAVQASGSRPSVDRISIVWLAKCMVRESIVLQRSELDWLGNECWEQWPSCVSWWRLATDNNVNLLYLQTRKLHPPLLEHSERTANKRYTHRQRHTSRCKR